MYKKITDLQFNDKIVLVRVDFNVPIQDGKITDDNRIKAALPTIKYLLEHKAKVVLFSHLGKVTKESDLRSKSMKIVCERLSELLMQNVVFAPEIEGSKLEKQINLLQSSEILLFENTRFADITDQNQKINLNAKRESKNDNSLGKYWASLGDIFVNDAFGTCHRAHASNVGIANNIKESCLGFLVDKEISMLSKITDNPERPLIAILGGAKVSDKIQVIDQLLKIADKIVIGGGMSYTFMHVLGYKIGDSLLEQSTIPIAKAYLKDYADKIILPIDYGIAPEFKNVKPEYTEDQNIKDGYMGLDVGPKTNIQIKKILVEAKTIFWNGPVGVFEFPYFAKGTEFICKTIAKLGNNVFSVIGGGDSASAAINLGYENNFSHISTGGGASLDFIANKPLPGIECIQQKN